MRSRQVLVLLMLLLLGRVACTLAELVQATPQVDTRDVEARLPCDMQDISTIKYPIKLPDGVTRRPVPARELLLASLPANDHTRASIFSRFLSNAIHRFFAHPQSLMARNRNKRTTSSFWKVLFPKPSQFKPAPPPSNLSRFLIFGERTFSPEKSTELTAISNLDFTSTPVVATARNVTEDTTELTLPELTTETPALNMRRDEVLSSRAASTTFALLSSLVPVVTTARNVTEDTTELTTSTTPELSDLTTETPVLRDRIHSDALSSRAASTTFALLSTLVPHLVV